MKRVFCYDSRKKLVKTYRSVKDAAKDVGVYPEKIRDAIRKETSKLKGYYWRDHRINSRSNESTVIQRDDKYHIVNKFDSILDAADATGISAANIYHCIDGSLPHCKGFTFEYENYAPMTYVNPHSEEERKEYRRRVMYIAEKLHINDYVIDDEVRAFHKWERKYSRK